MNNPGTVDEAHNQAPLRIFGLFPGQGSQHVGMAKELHENFKIVERTFEEASDAVHVNLRKLCFEGSESDLTLTENTQPCLLTASVAAFRVAVQELDFRPEAVIGHSLGEYSALVAAGVLPLSTAAYWVRERGLAMQIAVPAGQGTMAAILGLESEQVIALCAAGTQEAIIRRKNGEYPTLTVEAIVEPANFNAPGQVVIAGSIDAVEQAMALLKSDAFKGGKAIPLQVSAPFHCRLMAPARSRMSELFANATALEMPRPPSCPYVPNRTAVPTQETGVVFDLLAEQVDHPVLWDQSVNSLLAIDYSLGIEFGPGKVLTGLTKRIAMRSGKTVQLAHMSDVTTLKTLSKLLKRDSGSGIPQSQQKSEPLPSSGPQGGMSTIQRGPEISGS